jgi:DeoR family glycerol-3-phosphate regulon repressor
MGFRIRAVDGKMPRTLPGRKARSMQRDARHASIVNLVRQRGFMSIDALAQHFNVTPQTVRRDINELSDQDLVQRYHGGAGLASSVENTAYTTRRVQQLAEKQRIAELCAQHIPNDSSLFINIGTTNEEVARALLKHSDLRVITNNLQVASILCENPAVEVIIAGGTVRPVDRAIIGEVTSDFVAQFRVDFGIIGISGIDSDGSLLDFDYREVRVSQTIVEHSRQVFLVADHSKFERKPMVRLGDIAMLDAFFTDRAPPQSVLDQIEKHDVRLYVADKA